MTLIHEMTRRAAVQSLLLLPSALAFAREQSPAITDKDRALWNKVYSEEDWRVTTYPNRLMADAIQGKAPGRALDVGMGQGRNALFLARSGWDVTGIDISDKGIDIAKKDAEKANVKLSCVVADFANFDVGKEQWDLVSGIYMGDLILTHAKRIAEGLRQGGILVAENFHQDINVIALTGGKLGYPVNALIETFAPLLRIVHYEETLDFPDWSNRGLKVPLVRMLARKG